MAPNTYSVSGVSNIPKNKNVRFEDGIYWDGNEEWFPQFKNTNNHYLCTQYDDIVQINKIKLTAGNPQSYKKERINKSIANGYLPAIKVKNVKMEHTN